MRVLDVSVKEVEWRTKKVEVKSRINITENFSVMSEKKYNWLQRKMWKMLLNINIEKV